jgi:hypothetical protein
MEQGRGSEAFVSAVVAAMEDRREICFHEGCAGSGTRRRNEHSPCRGPISSGSFAYTPLSGPEFGAGARADIWPQMITFTELAALAVAVEIVVTCSSSARRE